MTWEQYWYGDVWMVEAFLEADKLKRDRFNAQAHLQGLYVYEAIGDMAPILHAFAKSGSKPRPYPEKPYSLNGEDEEEKAAKEEQERVRARLYMNNFVRWGANWGKGK
jgi:hypothetical protein